LLEKSVLIQPQLWQNLVLERFLVRLSQSEYAPQFILKGGVLLAHYVELNRHTLDLDFLVKKLSNDTGKLKRVLADVIRQPVNDGFTFTDLKVKNLSHPHMKYPGLRATMWSLFGKTRFQVNVDLGFGDVITPTTMTMPLISGNKGALLESEVEVICYPKEFIFAEKLETIIYRGADNSRMKDFHDLGILIGSGLLDPKRTERVVELVFEHRETERELPILFTEEDLVALQQMWRAHLRGLPREHTMPLELSQLIRAINFWLEKNTQLVRRSIS